MHSDGIHKRLHMEEASFFPAATAAPKKPFARIKRPFQRPGAGEISKISPLHLEELLGSHNICSYEKGKLWTH